MNERDIKIDLLRVCKVAGSDGDFNAVAFHTLCDKLKQLGAADERADLIKFFDNHWRSDWSDDQITEALEARGNT
jgi:hypothetical protein